ncbi:putative oxalocrotonate tautomerase enzyme-domain-containing protein [Armillaria luteobubalina]|uniref:Oxalocrotonate tautomerase enzyme-domain-containing protein n=1 Tax=Armillaria luteobubalina TaxID=153913 RepID=A0AA39UVQ2_9AGAR|nr:putative oxalocrotonate tautomerase enzyme-domain-containing protein [Armillaria luteobubalina]
MPLHRFYTPIGFYSKEDKAAVVKAVDKENFYVGAEATDNFVRLVVHHMAAHFSNEYKKEFMEKYEKALEPFIKARGADWEIQIAEMDRHLWGMNGINPPPRNSEAETRWIIENRPSEY